MNSKQWTVALAALEVVKSGAGRVLILDLDAHCGGGTHSIIGEYKGVWHTDISTSGFDAYEPDANGTLCIVNSQRDYLWAIEEGLAELSGQDFALCLYNAGMDPIGDVNKNTLAMREEMVFDWCRERSLPVAFVLAGGYEGPDLSKAALVDLHRLTIEAAARSCCSQGDRPIHMRTTWKTGERCAGG